MQLTRAERQKRSRDRAAGAELRLRDKLHARILEAGGDPKGMPTIIPARVWYMCLLIVGDPSGKAARSYLRTLANKPAAGAIIRACENGGRYSWAQLRARRICALGIALVELAKSTRRRGPWGSLVMGVGRGALCALLRNPYEPDHDRGTPAITTLFGTHREGGNAENGEVGYFHALREAGLCYRQQLPREVALPCETWGPSGYATNRYWLVATSPELVDNAEFRAAIVGLERCVEAARDAWAAAQRRRHRPPK